MAYVQVATQNGGELGGFFSVVGGAFKKAGGFVAKKVVPAALPFVPVVGGAASTLYQKIPGIAPGQAPAPRATSYRPHVFRPETTTWQRIYQGTRDTLSRDPEIRRRAVEYTSRLPPELLAAAAARQAREASPLAKAGFLVPLVVGGALLLRRRR